MTFSTWLKANNFQPSTTKAALRGVKQMAACHASGRRLPNSCLYNAKRILLYVEQVENHEFDSNFVDYLQTQGIKKTTRLPKAKPRRRLLEARSIDDLEWKALRAAFSHGTTREDEVLYLVLASGLRVGDMLRTPRSELNKALTGGVLEVERKGGTFVPVPIRGLENQLRALYAKMKKADSSNVAEYVCPSNDSALAGECAYKRLSRHLKKVAEAVGVTGRKHIHRLRRTLAVRGLKRTKDLIAVQQMLGLSSVTSAQRYTDEIREDDVAEIRRSVHEDD